MPSTRAQSRKNRHGRSSFSQMMCRLKYASMLSWPGLYIDQSGDALEIATA